MERCLRRRNIYIPKGVPNASEVFLFSEKIVRRGFLPSHSNHHASSQVEPLRLKGQALNPPPLEGQELYYLFRGNFKLLCLQPLTQLNPPPLIQEEGLKLLKMNN